MRYTFIYFALLFAVFSCKKNDPNVCTTGVYKSYYVVKINPSLESYQFKQGSYWLYKNDVTSQIDSQYVVSAGHNDFTGEYPSACSGGAFVYEYRITVESALINKRFDYNIIGSSIYKDTAAKGSHGGRYIFNNLSTSYPESGYEQTEIIPSMNFNGNTVQNIKKVRLKHLNPTASLPYPYNLSDYDLYYYFADHIGLVKWEVVDGSTVLESWSIQSWEVIL